MALSAPGSTVPAAKAYLFTQLQARSEFAAAAAGSAPVGVFYDTLGKRIPDDWVMVGDVAENTVVTESNMVGGGGRYWLQEQYTVTVVCQAFRGGDQPQLVFERAAFLADVVIDVVRLDPSLGGRVTQCMPVKRDWTSDWAADNLGRLTECRVDFECIARL